MTRFSASMFVLFCVSANSISFADELDVAAAPPAVVKTVPQAGAANVDPNLTEIRVTFSKGMRDGNWSWATVTKESFPKITVKPKYEKDKRTCVIGVKLERGKTYGIWVNSAKFKNFKDPQLRPAIPYLLIFRTKD